MGIDVMSIFLRNEFLDEVHATRNIYFICPSVSELWAVILCAIKIGMVVTNTTNIAVTFVIGRLCGLSIWE